VALQKRIGIQGILTENLQETAEKCTNLNMSFWVKYLLESTCYAIKALQAIRAEIKARPYKQKEIPEFHVEQFLFVREKT
jgi:hypothetical protein